MSDPESMQGINDYWRQLDDGEIAAGQHREMVGGLWDDLGRLQLERLLADGLQPSHQLLDVGCGALRGGLHFVRFLDPGHYCGLDVNPSLLAAGRHELDLAGLTDRDPMLIEDAQFEVGRFDRQFEWAMAQSVFTHLPINLVILCLAKVAEVLTPKGRFYATFFRAPRPACLETLVHQPGGAQTQYHRDIFHYAAEEMEWMGRVAGLETEVVGDWGHPRAQQLVIYHLP